MIVAELRERLLNKIREDSEKCQGVNRLGAIHILMYEYGMSMNQSVDFTRDLGDIVYREKFGVERN